MTIDQFNVIIIVVIALLFLNILRLRVRRTKALYANLEPATLDISEFSGTTKTLKSFGVGGFTIKIPDGWVVYGKDFKSGLVFSDTLDYRPGSPFTKSSEALSADISRFMASWGRGPIKIPKEYSQYSKKSLPEINGNKALLFEYTFSNGESIGSRNMKDGEKHYAYYIIKGRYQIDISYYVFDGDEENKQLIESVVSTVKF